MLGPLLLVALLALLGLALAKSSRARAARAAALDASDAERAPAQLPIEGAIDLHFFAPRDVPSVVDEYLSAARRAGLSEVRVIHGKGKGVQRARVQKQLARHPLVVSFRSDGLGSTLVLLRPRKG